MNIITNKVKQVIKEQGSVYFRSFDEKKIEMALMSGDITLKNLELEPKAFLSDSQPFKIETGKIEEITLEIPWKNLFNEACVIRINGANLKIKTKQEKEINLTEEEEYKALLNEVVLFAKAELGKLIPKKGGIMDFWLLKGLIDRVTNNLQISIRNLRIELHHDDPKPENKFILEFGMREFDLHTTDSSFQNKIFTKMDSKEAKEVYKLISLTNLTVKIRPADTPGKDRHLSKEDYTVFKFSFSVKLIKQSTKTELLPEYDLTGKLNQNDFSISHWQIQRVMSLLEFMKLGNSKLESIRSTFKSIPQERISSYNHVKLQHKNDLKDIVESKESMQKRKVITNWWQYCITETCRDIIKQKKDVAKSKLYGVVSNTSLDKIYASAVPKVVLDYYGESFAKYLDGICENNFDTTCIKDQEKRVHTLKTLIFILPKKSQKAIAKRVVADFAVKVKSREQNTWMNYAKSWVPFLGSFGNDSLSSEEKQMKELLNSEIGKGEEKFGKYILRVNVEIKRGSYCLRDDKTAEGAQVNSTTFGLYTKSFVVDFNMFSDKTEAQVSSKGFEFLFERNLNGRVNNCKVIQSTNEPGTNFLDLNFVQLKGKDLINKSIIDMKVQHIDIIFINNIISELSRFFKVEENSELAGNAMEKIEGIRKSQAALKQKAPTTDKSEMSMSISIKSPRLLTPLTMNLSELDSNTNLFVFYLGDMEFVNVSKPSTKTGTTYDLQLNHCKVEFWEDYGNAVEALGMSDEKDEIMEEKANVNQVNFILLDLVAKLKYSASQNSSKQSVMLIMEYFDVKINPYIFHQLIGIQDLLKFDSAGDHEYYQRAKRNKVNMSLVKEGRVAVRADATSQFRLRHMILSDNTLYLYMSKEDFKVMSSIHLSNFKMRCVQDYKREGFILKLQKDKKVFEIAFRTLEEARDWINCLLESIPSISFMNSKEEVPSQEKAEDAVDSSMTIDVMIKQLNVTLFNEIFEKTTLLNIQYLDMKYSQDKASKVKLSFDSVLLENFEKTYASRGLKTIIWIGSTQAPVHDDTKTILADVSQLGESKLNQPTFSNISQIQEEDEFVTQNKQKKFTNQPFSKSVKSPSKGTTTVHEKENPLNATSNPRSNLEKGMILFVAIDKASTDIDIHIVNIMTYFDSDYINNLIKRLDQYKKKSLTPAAPAKVKPKKKASVAVENLLMKVNLKIDRLTLVCRSKNLNMFDVVFMNMRMIYSSFNTRMLINLYAKKFALRDLTGYPFTKSPHELRDYKNQKKQIIASFDSAVGSNAESLDNNCLIVLCEIPQPEMIKSDRIGTKAEIMLNNGEINFFMQPIFRFLDFLFFPLMGLLVPDDTLTAPLEVLRQRVTDPTKLSYNVFLKNTKVNMLPNYLSDKMLKFEIPMIKIVNEINEDPSRKKVSNQDIKLHSENISIEIDSPRIRGLKEGLDLLESRQIVISFEKLGYAGYLNRLFGQDRIWREVDNENKIVVAIDELALNMRRDEFYALMTYVFNNVSHDDEMDKLLMNVLPNPEDPIIPMTVKVLIQPMAVHMKDDDGLNFFGLNYSMFVVDLAKSKDKNQVIKIYGRDMNGDIFNHPTEANQTPDSYKFAFLKPVSQFDLFCHSVGKENVNVAPNRAALIRDVTHNMNIQETQKKQSIAMRLNAASETLRNSDSNFFMEVNQSKSGDKDINITLKEIGINLVMPAIWALQKLTGMTEEMGMNRLIKQSLTKYYSRMTVTINIKDAFIFLQSPDRVKTVMILHVPALSVLYEKVFLPKEQVKREELLHLEPEEFTLDKTFSQINEFSSEAMVPVFQMNVVLHDYTLSITYKGSVQEFAKAKISQGEDFEVYRELMSATYVSYNIRHIVFGDSYNEITFSKGIANLGQLNIFLNTSDLDYFSDWSNLMVLPYLSGIKLSGDYEETLRALIVQNRQIAKPAVKKVYKKNLDIVFNGLNLTLIDDVFKTNLAFLRLVIQPLQTSQISNRIYSGFKNVILAIEGSVLNYNCNEWEPFLENFTMIMDSYTETETGVGKTNVLLGEKRPTINFTTELDTLIKGINSVRARRVVDRNIKKIKKNIGQTAQNMIFKKRLEKEYEKLSVVQRINPESLIGLLNQYQQNANTSHHNNQGLSLTDFIKKSGKLNLNHSNLNGSLSKLEPSNLVEINPLAFKFNEQHQVDRQGISMSRASQVSRRGNPLRQPFGNHAEELENREVYQKIKEDILSQREEALFEEIFQKETPYSLENKIGKPILFQIQFMNASKNVIVNNLDVSHLEYPFTLEMEMAKMRQNNKAVISTFRVYELDENYDNPKQLHKGTQLKAGDRQKVSYDTGHERLNYFTFDIVTLIMKYNIALQSPLQIVNHTNKPIDIHFMRAMDRLASLAVANNNILPVPMDKINSDLFLSVKEVRRKGEPRLVLDTVLDMAESDVAKYAFNEHYEMSISHTVNNDIHFIHLAPPLIIRNLLLQNITVSIFKDSMNREYGHEFAIDGHESGLLTEVYLPLNGVLRFSLRIGDFASKIHEGLMNPAQTDQVVSHWMTNKKGDKFSVNSLLSKRNGAYVVSLYCPAFVIDELFLVTTLTQRGQNFDGRLIQFEAEQVDTSVVSSLKNLFSSTPKTEVHEGSAVKSPIFMQPYPKEPIYLSYSKDQYQVIAIDTGKIGDEYYEIDAAISLTGSLNKYSILATNSVITLSDNPLIVANVTHLKHRYLVFNQTENSIALKQNKFLDSRELHIRSGAVKPLYFSLSDLQANKFVNLYMKGYEASDDLLVNKLSMTYFSLKASDQKKVKVKGFDVESYSNFSLEVTIENSCFMLNVRQEKKVGSINFTNKLEDSWIMLSQDQEKLSKGVSEVYLEPEQTVPYSWPKHNAMPQKLWAVMINAKTGTRSSIFKVNYKEEMNSYDVGGIRVYHNSEWSGASINLVFTPIMEKSEGRKLKSEMTVLVPYLGVSVVCGTGETRSELVLLSIRDMSVKKENFDSENLMSFKIRCLNVDNTSESRPYYPILLTPAISYENLLNLDRDHIDVFIRTANQANSSMVFYKEINIELISNIIKIEESFIHSLLMFNDIRTSNGKIIERFMVKGQQKSWEYENEMKKVNREELVTRVSTNWKNQKKTQGPASTYVNQINISEHEINFSLKNEAIDNTDSPLKKYAAYLSSMGFDYLISIDDLSIVFGYFELEKDTYPIQTVQQAIMSKYKSDGIRTALSGMLDLNLFGNPQKFAKTIKKGIIGLVDKPIARRKKENTVVSVAKGIGEGTGTFARYTAIGTFGSVSNIVGSLANFSSKVSLDQQYAAQRERLKAQRPQNFQSSMGHATEELAFSMKDTVAGVFTKQHEMTEKEGLLGAFKGAFLGLGGLVTKPVTGILDFASTATGGLRQACDYDELKPSTSRLREPRAFYGEGSLLKPYNDLDAEVFNSYAKKQNDQLVSYNEVKELGQNRLLINTVDHIYCKDINKPDDVEWCLTKKNYFVTYVDAAANTIDFQFRDFERNQSYHTSIQFFSNDELREFVNTNPTVARNLNSL